MSDTVKSQETGTMIPVEKAGKLLQDAVVRTAEIVGETYEKFYENQTSKTQPAKAEPTPEVKASSTEVAQPEASQVAPDASVETKTEEPAIIQSTSKENKDMKVSAETKQVVPGGPDKPLVSGIGKPTDKIKAPHGQFPDVPGYETVEKVKVPIEPAKAGKDSLTTKHDGDNASLVNQSDAFIKSLMSARGLQTGIDMKKKIWAMLQKPEGAKLLAKVVRTASLVGSVRTGAALDFIAAKKKLNTTK